MFIVTFVFYLLMISLSFGNSCMDNWLISNVASCLSCDCLTLWCLVFGSQSVGHCLQWACHRVWVWGLETWHIVQTAHLQHQHGWPQPGNSLWHICPNMIPKDRHWDRIDNCLHTEKNVSIVAGISMWIVTHKNKKNSLFK